MSNSQTATVLTRNKKEVSCLALTFFYDYLETQGISRIEIQKELPYTPEHLNDNLNWIDYDTFIEIEKRIAHLFEADDQVFYKIGKYFSQTQGFGFIRVLARAVISPVQLYKRIPQIVPRFLFQ